MNAERCDDSPQAVGSPPATINQYHQAAQRPQKYAHYLQCHQHLSVYYTNKQLIRLYTTHVLGMIRCYLTNITSSHREWFGEAVPPLSPWYIKRDVTQGSRIYIQEVTGY